MENYQKQYSFWCEKLAGTPFSSALLNMDEAEKQDAFYQYLAFGTAGMRGILGLGTNRMNIYTVMRSSKGLADYICEREEQQSGVAIAYDSRNMSAEFAKTTAEVLCANGIRVYLSPMLKSVPQLSYAVLKLKTAAGVVITASHNPPEYNGYKVYGPDGGQLEPGAADLVTQYIDRVDDPFNIQTMDLAQAEAKGLLTYMTDELDQSYYREVSELVLQPDIIRQNAHKLKVVYTPLFGAGSIPVQALLKRIGITNLHVVHEQEQPNGDFPGLSAPNPENPEAFTLARALADQVGANLIFATDPDSDRLGVCARGKEGVFQTLTGNQIGCLLLDYILTHTQRQKDDFAVKSIVSTPMADAVCARHGVEMRNVYTGFKFIAEQIKISRETGRGNFLFGFEESYGFLRGTFVRDKDAIIASVLLCETACYYASRGMTLLDALDELSEKYGYFMDRVLSKSLSGIAGIEKIKHAVECMRANPPREIGGQRVMAMRDYNTGLRTTPDGDSTPLPLPSANVVYFELEHGRFILRPSGTEPKLKSYLSVQGEDAASCAALLERLTNDVEKQIEELTH